MQKAKVKGLREMSNAERQETRETVIKLHEFGYDTKQIADMTGLTTKQVYYIKNYFCGVALPVADANQKPTETYKGEWAYVFTQEWDHMRHMFGKGATA